MNKQDKLQEEIDKFIEAFTDITECPRWAPEDITPQAVVVFAHNIFNISQTPEVEHVN